MTCNNIILSQPNAGATLNHEIPDDVSARLNFGPDDISGLRIGDGGELVISFAEGGQLNITNFNSVVDNGNLIYLEDGTLIDPSILTGSLRSPQDFNNIETAAGSAGDVIASAVQLEKPKAGATQNISAQDGKQYVCDFDPSNANVEMRDGKMFLTFADGSQIVVNNFENAQLPEELLIPEQEILTEYEVIESIEEILAVEPIEETLTAEVVPAEVSQPKVEVAESVAEQIASIAPAAGEVDSVAQTLNDITPAAGEPVSGSNTGFGFISSADAAALNSPLAIGPLNPTSLQYVAPVVSPERAPIDFVSPVDDAPTITSTNVVLDETASVNNGLVGTGIVDVDFGADGPGTILPNGDFDASCELAGGALTSRGVPVDVTQTANGYVGTANGETVFTFVLDPATGEFVYTQILPFDHGDTTDTDEDICLHFGVVATDADGDAVAVNVDVIVADDAPIIGDDERTVDETSLVNGVITINGSVDDGSDESFDFGEDGMGSVMTAGQFSSTGSQANGNLSSDGVDVVVTQTANGYVGAAGGVTVFTLDVDSMTGDYTFRQFANLDHANGNDDNDVITLNFPIKITDFDGDSDPGVVVINVQDGAPIIGDDENTVDETNLVNGVITVNDSVSVDFGADGKGAVMTTGQFSSTGSQANGALSSNGVSVVVTQTANGYVGAAGGVTVFTLDLDSMTGEYTFQQFAVLDHADGNDDNDVIALNFPIKITDADGDSEAGVITINVRDDAPEANDDTITVDDGQTVTGNVQGNDASGQDDASTAVTQVMIAGTTYDVPANGTVDVPGQFGTLTIAADGSYTYVAANGNEGGMDQFKYTLRDADGDTDTAVLKVTVEDDETPIDINGVGETDDTDLLDDGMDMVSGTINVNYQGDGPGTTTGNDNFASSGNQTGDTLSSNGVPVVVTFNATTNTYTGVAGGTTVFTMVINSDATYKFTQLAPVDHSNTNADNEALFLDFGVTATDSDGDTGTGTVRITVRDDAPIIGDDANTVDETIVVNGVITVNDSVSYDFGEDGQGSVMTAGDFSSTGSKANGALTSGGVALVVTQTANGYVGAAGGVTIFTLDIASNTGDYTFKQFGQLDHADGSNANDVITLNFPIKITDFDGDTDPGVIKIDVRDDAPEARDDKLDIDNGNQASGNVISNDDIGADENGTVTSVTFEGQSYNVPAGGSVTVEGDHGTLVMSSDGTYTYDANNAPQETVRSFNQTDGFGFSGAGEIQQVSGSFNESTNELNFSFTIEGTQANGFNIVLNGGENPRGNGGEVAMLYFDASRPGTPEVTAFAYSGDVNTFRDGDSTTAGFQTPDRIVGTNDANNPFSNITTTVDANGNTVFTLSLDATSIINHDPLYPVAGTEWTGTGFGEELGIWFHAFTDVDTTYDADGNLLTFFGNPEQSGWDDSNVPTTLTTVGGRNEGEDQFTYTVTDADGDTDTAHLDICVHDDNDVPTLVGAQHQVREFNIANDGEVSITDTVSFDFGDDGAGRIQTSGIVEVKHQEGGAPQQLTSGGVAVVITQTANGYVGRVAGETLFTFVIDANTGEYTYKQFGPVDHPGVGNANNDVLWLKLGIEIVDADGDTDSLTDDNFVVLDIYDDEPKAVDDTAELDTGETATGNVLANDDVVADTNASVTTVTFEGQDYNVPANGSATVEGDHGTLVINSNGTYSYEANDGPQETVYSFRREGSFSGGQAGDIQVASGSFNPGTNEFDFSFAIDADDVETFRLVLNGGHNPRDNGGEVAVLYFDATGPGEPVITAYAYSGQSLSYLDGDASQAGNQAPDRILSSTDANDAFSHISVTTDANGNRVFSFSLDATDIINHDPLYPVAGTEWTGVGFGEELGIWFHAYKDPTTSYDADGNLLTFTNTNESWWDESYVPTTITTVNGGVSGTDRFTYTVVDGDGDTDTAHLDVSVQGNGEVTSSTQFGSVIFVDEGVYSGTDAADKFIFTAISNAAPILENFEIGTDRIELISLLRGVDDVTAAIEDFVFVTDSADGQDTLISVDTDGQGGAAAELVARIEGTNDNTLADLIDNNTIVV